MKAAQQKIIQHPSLQQKIASNWPIILFLHGGGEMAKGPGLGPLDQVKKNGIPKIVENLPHTEERDAKFPFIAVSPQAGYPRKYGWDPFLVKQLLEDVIQQHKENVDESRIYLTGISMGGYGTWATAAEFPDLFAAILPICGGCNPEAAPYLASIPIWNFHGKQDSIIPVAESDVIIQALRKVEAKNLKYTVYPDADHDSWTVTYENPAIYDWLLKQAK